MAEELKNKSEYFFNRELSWIEFNRRVLEEAADKSNPLLERIKFTSIFSTNLDEFFMIRVSGLKRQVKSGVNEVSSDGYTARDQRDEIFEILCPLVKEQYRIFNEELIPGLTENDIQFFKYEELDENEKGKLEKYFDNEIFPVLTPIALDNVHPFPNLVNRTIALAIKLIDPDIENPEEKISLLQVPSNFPRFHQINKDSGYNYILLEDIIKANAYKLFPGMKIIESYAFRITRNADLELEEEEADDLLTLIAEEVKKRRLGIIVRFEVEDNIPDDIFNLLVSDLSLEKNEIYRINGLLNLGDLMYLYNIDKRNLKYEGFAPRITSSFREEDNFFKAIKKNDVFIHHPFYSFSSVSEFIAQAAEDPNVFAIKLTLYRTSGDSPIIKSLIDAAENGKQVTAIVELKARFDEENNIIWARALENAGVHVVYGIAGLKTHCKMALVVRREEKTMKRYLHLSTGNYNPITAKIYTDFGLFTCDEDFCTDASNLFNYLTGYSKFTTYKRLLVAPFSMRKSLIRLIEEEVNYHKEFGNGYILFKMNSLVDDKTIMKLYNASSQGVKIDLIVRGICRLKPNVKDLSDNINVYSIVGRFLEHSRAYLFNNNGNPVIYTGSADIMERNFDRRVEILYPIENKEIKQDIADILNVYLKDNVKTRVLANDGSYYRKFAGEESINAQEYLVAKVKKKSLTDIKKEHRKKVKKHKLKTIN
jgi:polyphosphate kinase